MDDARDVVDEEEWRDLKLHEAIFGIRSAGGKNEGRFYNVMVESFGTWERRKPREAQNPFKSYLDCKRLTGFTPRAHSLREASLLIVWLNQSLFEAQPSFD